MIGLVKAGNSRRRLLKAQVLGSTVRMKGYGARADEPVTRLRRNGTSGPAHSLGSNGRNRVRVDGLMLGTNIRLKYTCSQKCYSSYQLLSAPDSEPK